MSNATYMAMSDARPPSDLEYLEYLVMQLHGRYTIGYVAPVHDAIVAIASGARKVMVTLVAQEGESIEAVRRRLIAAIVEVMEGGEPVNELAERGIEFSVARRRMPRRVRVEV